MENNEFIYVYDRINREIHECKITKNYNNIWLYYMFNNEECSYWTKGCKVSSLDKSFKCSNYRYLVSTELKSLKEIEESDNLVYNFLNQQWNNIWRKKSY